MAHQSGFAHDYEAVAYAASQFPNIPALASHLKEIAAKMKDEVEAAADALAQAAEKLEVKSAPVKK